MSVGDIDDLAFQELWKVQQSQPQLVLAVNEETPLSQDSQAPPVATDGTTTVATQGDPRIHEGHLTMGEALRTHLNPKNRKMMAVMLSSVLYFVVISIVFSSEQDWSVGDSIYTGVVIVTTVGYGDFLPETTEMKIAMILMIHFALSIVVLCLGIVQDIITHAASKIIYHKSLGLYDRKSHRRRKIKEAVMSCGLYVIFLLLGMIVYAQDDLLFPDDYDGDKYVDSLYLTVVTLTTVGFGDLSPQTDGMKAFGCFVMLFGIPAFGSCFCFINNVLYQGAHDVVVLDKIKRGTMHAGIYDDILTWVREMRADVGHMTKHAEDSVSRFEFFAFMLCKNGIIDKTHVKKIIKNFDHLDTTGTGFIDKTDIKVVCDNAQSSMAENAA